jgi:ribosomal protein L40E
MPEILTESFCERCGTRYTFESHAPRSGRMGRFKTLSAGLKNYVLSDEASLDEALADARGDGDRRASSEQLDAFHKTFNFCMSCRQYTCSNCWNEPEGRCLTCAPHLGREILPAPFPTLEPTVGLIGTASAANGNGNGHLNGNGASGPVTIDATSWPTVDLREEAGASTTPATYDAGGDEGGIAPTSRLEALFGVAPKAREPEPPTQLDEPAAIADQVAAPDEAFADESALIGDAGADDAMAAPEASIAAFAAEPATDETPTELTAPLSLTELLGAAALAAEPEEAPASHWVLDPEVAVDKPEIAAAAALEPEVAATAAPAETVPPETTDLLSERDELFPTHPKTAYSIEPEPLFPAHREPAYAIEPESLFPSQPAGWPASASPSTVSPAPVVQPALAPAASAMPAPAIVEPVVPATPVDMPAVPPAAAAAAAAEVPSPAPIAPSPATDEMAAAAASNTAVLLRRFRAARPATDPTKPALGTAAVPEPLIPIAAEAAFVAEPVAETVAPTPEPVAPLAAAETPVAAVAAEVPEVAADAEPGPAVETPPAEIPAPPARPAVDTVEAPVWRMVAPETAPPPAPAPAVAAPKTNGHDRSAEPPQWPTAPAWPAAAASTSRNVPVTGADAIWAQSSKDVLNRPEAGVQACLNCGLPLSSTARFCRRCGTSQISA